MTWDEGGLASRFSGQDPWMCVFSQTFLLILYSLSEGGFGELLPCDNLLGLSCLGIKILL